MRVRLLFPPIKFVLFLPLSLSSSLNSVSPHHYHSTYCIHFYRISGTALYLENRAARKRHGIEQKLYPKASMHYKSLHSDNRNIEPQVTENTYCWLHNVWRMRHPWSTLDLCIKQHLLEESNHRENSVLAFSGVTLGHKKVESTWLTANQCSKLRVQRKFLDLIHLVPETWYNVKQIPTSLELAVVPTWARLGHGAHLEASGISCL